jgi:intracellular multiplication protein IcmO
VEKFILIYMKPFAEDIELSPRLKRLIEQLYAVKFGGTTDTLAVCSVGFGLLASSPALSESLSVFPYSMTPLALSAAGFAWLTHRVTKQWMAEHILSTSLKIRSDKSTYTPESGKAVGGLLLGYTTDTGAPIYVDWEHLMRHVFILGQSGVGKTVAGSLMMFQHIQAGGGLLFIDGKIDSGNIEQLYHFAAYCGRSHDLYVINTDDPENSNSYNPILFGDPDEKADALLQQIPSTESNPGADYYKQEAKVGLTILIRALQTCKLAYNMIDLTVLLSSSEALLDLERKLAQAAPGSEAQKEYALFLNKFKEPNKETGKPTLNLKKLADTFGGMAGRLYGFGTGKFGKILNAYDPDVNLFEAIRSNKIVYIALATMGKDATARNFGKLVISDMRTAISWLQRLPENERPWPPFIAFCDEAGSYANDSWNRIPEQARSAHVVFMPAAQTVANFQAISEELYQMIIGNAWNKLFFKIGTQASAVEAAELVGQYLGTVKSLSDTQTQSSSSAFLRSSPDQTEGRASGIALSERQEQLYHVSADDFKHMSKGECVVTWGDTYVYNLRIPMLKLDSESRKRFGPPRLNRFRSTGLKINGAHVRPAGYFENVERFLQANVVKSLESEQEASRAQDTRSYKAHDKRVQQLQAKNAKAEEASSSNWSFDSVDD